MNSDLKFTIITICKNSELTIEKTIKSVLSQTYKNIEYFIIDGASQDNTLKILNNYNNRINKIISESDNGIYNAMNKGISISSGDFIIFLNSDDMLYSETIIEKISKIISINENYDIFYGNVLINDQDRNKSNIWRATKVSKFSLYRGAIPHPATIYKNNVFDICGIFDESYKIAGDYEWIVRAFIKFKLNYYYIDETISVFNKGGVSTIEKNSLQQVEERERIRKKYYTYSERKYYNLRWFFKKI